MADLDLKVKLTLPKELLARLAAAPQAVPRIQKAWGKYMRAAARDRIRSGEGMAPLAASTVHKYNVTRTAKVTARGNVRTSYAKALGAQLKSKWAVNDLDELMQLQRGKSPSAPAVLGGTSKAVTNLRKQLTKYKATGKRVGGNRRKIQGHKLLGKLAQAFTFNITGSAVVITNHIPWSGVHNLGGKVGNGATLPARPFLFFSSANEQRLAEIAGEELLA